MPNNVTSSVEIKGSKDKLEKLIKHTKLQLNTEVNNNEFDFNAIVKMPEELHDTVSPPQIVDTEEEALKINEEFKENIKVNPWDTAYYRAISKAEEERRIKEYGAVTWYEWATKNWGTKWNAYDVTYISHDDNHLVLDITTAWDTPRQIWHKLDEMGFDVNGVVHGEAEIENIGDGGPFFIKTIVEFEEFSGYEGEK